MDGRRGVGVLCAKLAPGRPPGPTSSANHPHRVELDLPAPLAPRLESQKLVMVASQSGAEPDAATPTRTPATRSSTCTSAARWRSVSTVALDRPDDLSLAYTPGRRPGLRGDRGGPVADPALHLGAQHRRRRHRRHRRARPGRHRPGRRDAGDGGQGGAVQAVRRRRRRAASAWTPPTPTRSSRPSSGWRRASAGSTSRTSPRPAASRSRTRLKERLDIPVFHDDQHGTAVVVLAALNNALRAHRPHPASDPGGHLRLPARPASRSPGSCSRPASRTSRSSTARAS